MQMWVSIRTSSFLCMSSSLDISVHNSLRFKSGEEKSFPSSLHASYVAIIELAIRAHQMWNVGIHPFLQSNCGYPSGPLDSSSLDIRYLFTTCLLGLSRRGKLPSQATCSLLICSLGPDPSPSLRKRVLSMKYEILWVCMVYIIQHIQIANSFMCNFDTLFLSFVFSYIILKCIFYLM